VLEGYVERGGVAGVVVLIDWRGAAHVETVGAADMETKPPD